MAAISEIKRNTVIDGITQWITYDAPTINNEQLTVELTFCEVPPNDKMTIPYLWYKHGFTDKFLQTFWGVQTYVKAADGSTPTRYNPTLKLKKQSTETIVNGAKTEYYGYETNFSWILEGTEANRQRLLCEIERMAFGESANIVDGNGHA